MNHADPVNAAFAASLYRLRTSRELSQLALAGRAGITPETIANIENALHGTSLATAHKLADALGTTVAAMLAPQHAKAGTP